MGLLNRFGRLLLDFLVIVIAILLFPGLPPKADYEETRFSEPRALEGPLVHNTRLSEMEPLLLGEVEGPESTAEWKGAIYTGSSGGRIVRVGASGTSVTVATLSKCEDPHDVPRCGHPLGMRFDLKGNLFVADSYLGIHRVNVTSGAVEVVVPAGTEVDGSPLRFFNDVAVSKSGVLYFTTSSSVCDLHHGYIELALNGTGRLLRHDPRRGSTELLLKGINFANGISLTADESALLISETGKFRMRRFWLTGKRAGKNEVFADNLPGFPDNIRGNNNGNFFVGICGLRQYHPLHEKIKAMPWVTRFVMRFFMLIMTPIRLTEQFFPNVYTKNIMYKMSTMKALSTLNHGDEPQLGMVVELDNSGAIIDSLYSDQVPCISQLSEHKGALFIGSPFVDFLGRVRPKQKTVKIRTVDSTGDLSVSVGA